MNEANENHVISATCTAPVNIAVVKYCKFLIHDSFGNNRYRWHGQVCRDAAN